jgi:hypothetical protein
MEHRSGLLTALALALALSCGCGTTRPVDEVSERAREVRERDGLGTGVKVRLYATVKAALRSLPPRDRLKPLVGTLPLETLDDWRDLYKKLAQGDARFAGLDRRPGLTGAAICLREALCAAENIAVAAAMIPVIMHVPEAAKGLGKLPLPSPMSFSQTMKVPVPALAELKELANDDEDGYPTLASGLFDVSDGSMRRLAVADVEHLALGALWTVAGREELAFYELARVRDDKLAVDERFVAALARACALMRANLYRLSLEEVAKLEPAQDEFAKLAAAAMGDAETGRAVARVAIALLRYEAYDGLHDRALAEKQLAVAQEAIHGKKVLAPLVHLLSARKRADALDFGGAAAEVRTAAAGLADDVEAKRRLEALAGELEKMEPERAARELVRAGREWVTRSLFASGLSSRVFAYGELVRQSVSAQLTSWSNALPDVSSWTEKVKGYVREKTGGAGR